MSSLNLVPNPTVMAIQAGLFIANFVAVKKLLLEPYLKVYDQRQNLTVGNKSEADKLLQENESTMKEIRERLQTANEEASSLRTELTSAANEKKVKLIAEAEQLAKATVSDIQSQIESSMAEEKKKVPSMVDEISTLIVKQVLNT